MKQGYRSHKNIQFPFIKRLLFKKSIIATAYELVYLKLHIIAQFRGTTRGDQFPKTKLIISVKIY